LRPVQFTYKNDANNGVHYGLIAEEVEQVYPELVVRDRAGESYSVRYHELPPMLLNELQKLSTKVADNRIKEESNYTAIQKNSTEIAKLYEVTKELSKKDHDNNEVIKELQSVINTLLVRIATLEKTTTVS